MVTHLVSGRPAGAPAKQWVLVQGVDRIEAHSYRRIADETSDSAR